MSKKKKSSSEYEIYKIFKVKCYPTKKQREFIDINLDGVYFVRNLYIKFNEKALKDAETDAEYDGTVKYLKDSIVDPDKFIAELTKLKDTKPFKWLKEKQCSTKSLRRAVVDAKFGYDRYFDSIPVSLDGKPTQNNVPLMNKPYFMKKPDPLVGSLYFINTGTDLSDIWTKHKVKIPVYGTFKVSGKQKFPKNGILQSGRIIKYYDGSNFDYYISFTFKFVVTRPAWPDNCNIGNVSGGLSIMIGLMGDGYIYMYDRDNDYRHSSITHFFENESYIKHLKKIDEFWKIVHEKSDINYNRLYKHWVIDNPDDEPTDKIIARLRREGMSSKNITKLKYKILSEERTCANIRKEYINKLIHGIIHGICPSFIILGKTTYDDIVDIKNVKLIDRVRKSDYSYFKKQLVSNCHEHMIPVFEANDIIQHVYKCPSCNRQIFSFSTKHSCVCDNCNNVILYDRLIDNELNRLFSTKRPTLL